MTTDANHHHFLHESDRTRSAVIWPGRCRTAFWVILFLEFYELYPPENSLRDPRYQGDFGNFDPDYRTFSMREYGNRVGIFRILKVLEKHRITATVAANAMALTERNSVAMTCHDAGHEIVAHGIAATRMASSLLSASDEQQGIDEARAAVVTVSGRAPHGWISQDFGESQRTTDLLAAAGFEWIGNWPNDDTPYFTTTQPRMVSIPYQNEWDDAQVIEVSKLPAWKWRRNATRSFDVLHSERGRVFGLGLHPWVTGHPHCISYLDQVLGHIMAAADVWQATGTEIAAAFALDRKNATTKLDQGVS